MDKKSVNGVVFATLSFLLASHVVIAEDLNVCFTEYSSVGVTDYMGRLTRNRTIDVCFIGSPSNGSTDYMGRRKCHV